MFSYHLNANLYVKCMYNISLKSHFIVIAYSLSNTNASKYFIFQLQMIKKSVIINCNFIILIFFVLLILSNTLLSTLNRPITDTFAIQDEGKTRIVTLAATARDITQFISSHKLETNSLESNIKNGGKWT